MHKIMNITTRTGRKKKNEMDRIFHIYGSMNGNILWKDTLTAGDILIFYYENPNNVGYEPMKVTSKIIRIKTYGEHGEYFMVETLNSIYYFKEINQ